MIRTQNLELPENARIIVISDIHGRIDVLKKLLTKVQYQKNEDYLILLGDFAQKGPYPLITLRYIMELSKYKNVYPVIGNCDRGNYKVFFKEWKDTYFKELLNIQGSVLYDMRTEYLEKENNLEFDNLDLDKKQEILHDYFKKEITFLENLPLMIETNDFIFVHAGIDKIRDYHLSYYKTIYMKRYFYFQGHLADKIVVCGHMPVTIYNRTEFNDNIIMDFNKKIISIDGGMTVKEGGQLNALIINKKANTYTYSQESEDGLSLKRLIKDSKEIYRGKGTCWPNYEVEVLEKDEYFTKVLLKGTNEITYVKNEYLVDNDTKTYDDCPASILGIKRHELVGIINDSCAGYVLVKYKGKQGWIEKGVLENEI